jgi:hypothetical protein
VELTTFNARTATCIAAQTSSVGGIGNAAMEDRLRSRQANDPAKAVDACSFQGHYSLSPPITGQDNVLSDPSSGVPIERVSYNTQGQVCPLAEHR